MLCWWWPLNLPRWNYEAYQMFLWVREVHMRVARIPFLVFGKAPIFAGCMCELLNVIRIAQILKHLDDLMGINDVTTQSAREFHID